MIERKAKGFIYGFSKQWVLLSVVVLVAVMVAACVGKRPALTDRTEAMRVVNAVPRLSDDLSLDTLAEGLRQNISQLTKLDPDGAMQFGADAIKRSRYIAALQAVLDLIAKGAEKPAVLDYIAQNFRFYEIYGDEQWGQVYLTGYYDPVIPGSLTPSVQYSRPLYRVPDDLVEIQFAQFTQIYPQLRPNEVPHREQVLRGRIVQRDGRLPAVQPYFSRADIDSHTALQDRGLELCWVRPIDAFILQIQGSGTVRLDNGERLRVGYASQNGHPYVAIGKYLTEHIPLEEMSMQRIRAYLETLDETQRQDMLNLNPSYVFFRPLEGKSVTSLGTEVTAGRTLATDTRFFPKGALAFLELETPVFDSNDSQAVEPVEWRPTARFVLDQDTGGAIRGGYRADLYWGEGDDAARAAGVMKRWGKLYYLAPKPEFLVGERTPDLM